MRTLIDYLVCTTLPVFLLNIDSIDYSAVSMLAVYQLLHALFRIKTIEKFYSVYNVESPEVCSQAYWTLVSSPCELVAMK